MEPQAVRCPKCKVLVDKVRWNQDERALLKSHIENVHPEEELQRQVNYNYNKPGVD